MKITYSFLLSLAVALSAAFSLHAQTATPSQYCHLEAGNNTIYHNFNGTSGTIGYNARSQSNQGTWIRTSQPVNNGDILRIKFYTLLYGRTNANDSLTVANAGLPVNANQFGVPMKASLYEVPTQFTDGTYTTQELRDAWDVGNATVPQTWVSAVQTVVDTKMVNWAPGDSASCQFYQNRDNAATHYLDVNWCSNCCLQSTEVVFELEVSGLSGPTQDLVVGLTVATSKNSALPQGPWDSYNWYLNSKDSSNFVGSNPVPNNYWTLGDIYYDGVNSAHQNDNFNTDSIMYAGEFLSCCGDYALRVEKVNNENNECGKLGEIDLNVQYAEMPLSYSWTGPSGFTSSMEDISNLSDGTYTVTITEDPNSTNYCQLTQSFDINVEPNTLPADYPVGVSGNGAWNVYHYDGENFDTYTGFDSIATLNFTQDFADPNNDGLYDAQAGCGVNVAQSHSARYRRTLSGSAGPYKVSFTADFHARISYDGGTTFSGYTNNYDQTVMLNGNEDIVIEYRNRTPGTANLTVDICETGVTNTTAFGNDEWNVYYYNNSNLTGFVGSDNNVGPTLSNRDVDAMGSMGVYTPDNGCDLELDGVWAAEYRMTLTNLPAGIHNFEISSTEAVNVEIGGTKYHSGSSYSIAYNHGATGDLDIVLTHYENNGGGSSLSFSTCNKGATSPTFSTDDAWRAYFYQGGLGPQNLLGVDLIGGQQPTDFTVDENYTPAQVSDVYTTDGGCTVDMSQPFFVVFRKEVTMPLDVYDVTVNTYGERLRWAWDGSRYWNWVSNLNFSAAWGGVANGGPVYDLAVQYENTNGAGGTDRVAFSFVGQNPKTQPDTEGVRNLEELMSGVTVYPNPASNYFEVNLGGAAQGAISLNLLDVQGRSLLRQTYTDQQVLRAELPSDIAPGVYLVNLTGENMNQTLRLVVGE